MGEALNYKDLPVVQRAFELVREADAFVQTLPHSPQGKVVADQLFVPQRRLAPILQRVEGEILARNMLAAFGLPALLQMKLTAGSTSLVIAGLSQMKHMSV